MKKTIKEGEQTKHASEFDDLAPTRELAEWSDAQRDQQETQRPHASVLGNIADRIRTEVTHSPFRQEQNERHQARQK